MKLELRKRLRDLWSAEGETLWLNVKQKRERERERDGGNGEIN